MKLVKTGRYVSSGPVQTRPLIRPRGSGRAGRRFELWSGTGALAEAFSSVGLLVVGCHCSLPQRDSQQASEWPADLGAAIAHS